MPTRLHRYYGAGYLHFVTIKIYMDNKQQVPPLRRPLRLRSGSGSGRNDNK